MIVLKIQKNLIKGALIIVAALFTNCSFSENPSPQDIILENMKVLDNLISEVTQRKDSLIGLLEESRTYYGSYVLSSNLLEDEGIKKLLPSLGNLNKIISKPQLEFMNCSGEITVFITWVYSDNFFAGEKYCLAKGLDNCPSDIIHTVTKDWESLGEQKEGWSFWNIEYYAG